MYSNRPVGFTVPVPYYGTPMAPRFFAPPTTQFQPMATVPRVPQPRATTVAVAPVQVQMPLPSQAVISQVPPTPQVAAQPQLVEKTFILREPQPEVNVNDELDTFYARMAKIRLEQRQLGEALALIRNIKSEAFRVRTVVSLAEYVSRDRSFQTEADTLFRLALAGMEALDRGEPFHIPSRVDGGVRGDVQEPIPSPVVTPPAAPPSAVVEPAPAPLPPDPPVTVSPELSPGDPVPRPPLTLEGEEAARRHNGNGRQPPPPPPNGNGVGGGIAVSPPESPPVFPDLAPPARTTEAIGSTPQTSPDSSTTILTQDTLPIRRPNATIPFDDAAPEKPRQPQTPTRRQPIILDEN